MVKRLFLLSGLAILGVVCNHTTSWGYTAMFWWTDRYRQVTVPNFEQVGTFSYYVLLVFRQLAVFCVPAFCFVSGFFAGYASGGSQSAPSWKAAGKRIASLLIPYLVWSGAIFAADAVQGTIYTPTRYLALLVTTGATGGYYFAPMLCQFYLLSPLLVACAKMRVGQLLSVSALLQWGLIALWYLGIVWQGPTMDLARDLTPYWLCIRWMFYFSLGIAASVHLKEFSQWLVRYRKRLSGAVVLLAIMNIIGPEMLSNATGTDWRSNPLAFSSSAYALAFILWFLSRETIPGRIYRLLYPLSGITYGIYLLHGKVMELVARVIRAYVPWALAYQALLLPILFIAGLGVPLVFMSLVTRSPARRYYRCLFG